MLKYSVFIIQNAREQNSNSAEYWEVILEWAPNWSCSLWSQVSSHSVRCDNSWSSKMIGVVDLVLYVEWSRLISWMGSELISKTVKGWSRRITRADLTRHSGLISCIHSWSRKQCWSCNVFVGWPRTYSAKCNGVPNKIIWVGLLKSVNWTKRAERFHGGSNKSRGLVNVKWRSRIQW